MKLFWLIFIFFIFEVGAKPKISIIIPVYNVERFLRECLDSVLNQTFTDFEVICINDASPDRCPEILREYAEKDKRIRVINHKKNAGIAAARNTGLDAAEGEYISFCDSDDCMHPDMLKIMYREIRRNNCDLAICQWCETGEYDKPVFKKNDSYTVNFPKDSLARNFKNSDVFFLVCNKIYKKSAIESLRFDPQMLAIEDGFFNMCAFRFTKKCVMTDAKLYAYRRNLNSITRSKSASALQKKTKGRCRFIENIYKSSYDSIPLSLEQKRIICFFIAGCAAVDIIFNHFEYENIVYTSEQMYDLYSKGFIDISCLQKSSAKIFIAPFVIIGKIRKWFRAS
jgi:glycosyltransferase involved in cell wall biosynthesis